MNPRDRGAEADGGPLALDLGEKDGGGLEEEVEEAAAGEKEKKGRRCGKREKVERAQGKARGDTDTDTDTSTAPTTAPAGTKVGRQSPLRRATPFQLPYTPIALGAPQAPPSEAPEMVRSCRVPHTLHLPLSAPHPMPSPPNQTRHIPSRSRKRHPPAPHHTSRIQSNVTQNLPRTQNIHTSPPTLAARLVAMHALAAWKFAKRAEPP
ncbi:hypothetical protein B0H14DRAFT_3874436 [Mycena olivaceomarginata]|nr:hypothetical protein B0H14DRAFT_3874436 [Mycena olivaceomarginata]